MGPSPFCLRPHVHEAFPHCHFIDTRVIHLQLPPVKHGVCAQVWRLQHLLQIKGIEEILGSFVASCLSDFSCSYPD